MGRGQPLDGNPARAAAGTRGRVAVVAAPFAAWGVGTAGRLACLPPCDLARRGAGLCLCDRRRGCRRDVARPARRGAPVDVVPDPEGGACADRHARRAERSRAAGRLSCRRPVRVARAVPAGRALHRPVRRLVRGGFHLDRPKLRAGGAADVRDRCMVGADQGQLLARAAAVPAVQRQRVERHPCRLPVPVPRIGGGRHRPEGAAGRVAHAGA